MAILPGLLLAAAVIPGLQDKESGGEPAPGAPSREPLVETIQGPLRGPLRYPAAGEGSLQVGASSVALKDVLSIQLPEKIASTLGAVVFFQGGDELSATIVKGDESEVHLRAYAARPVKAGDGAREKDASPEGVLRIPVEELRGIAFLRDGAPGGRDGAAFRPEGLRDARAELAEIRRWLRRPELAAGTGKAAAEAPAGPAPAEDRLLLLEGAELTGVLVKVDAEAVHFQSRAAGPVTIPLEKARALSIAAVTGGTEPAGREGEAPAKDGSLTAVVQYQDGSLLIGKLVALSPEGLRLAPPALGPVDCPLDRVRTVGFRGGRCQYLSDIAPEKVLAREGSSLPRFYDLGRDTAFHGGPIRIRGKEYAKGLGMHSEAHYRAEYRLKGRFSRFLAVLGMDDSARPESADFQSLPDCGVAVFRIHVDGRVVFEKELGWSDPPLPVDIPLQGAEVLALELDQGRGLFILDRGDWADARIILKD